MWPIKGQSQRKISLPTFEESNSPIAIGELSNIIYAVHRGEDNLANALDEMTSMKILSRIEGDADKIGNLLDRLESVISPQVQEENSDQY